MQLREREFTNTDDTIRFKFDIHDPGPSLGLTYPWNEADHSKPADHTIVLKYDYDRTKGPLCYDNGSQLSALTRSNRFIIFSVRG